MSTQWFYKVLGEEFGPCSASELKRLVAAKTIQEDSLVRKGPDGSWVPAWRVKGLFEEDLPPVISPSTSKGRHAALPPPIIRGTIESTKLDDGASESADNSLGLPNYDAYTKYTRKQDWKSICQINGVNLDAFGTKKELNVLSSYLERGEVVFALTSGVIGQSQTSNLFDFGPNTWLVVLTSERFLFLDHALLSKSVDTQSIRHDRVQAVSSSQGWVFGKITVDLGARTVTIDNCEKHSVAAMAKLANKWLAAREKKKDAPVTVVGGAPASSPLDELKKLVELHSMGALTDQEFQVAKAKLLASM